MERVKLEVRYRDDASKHRVKALKREGFIPGNLSAKGSESVPLEVEIHSLAKALKSEAGARGVIELIVEGGPKEANGPVLIKEIQKDHLGRHVAHVTFQKVSMKEKFTAPVSVVLHGEAVGVKRDGGILEQLLQEVEVKCLPTDLPPHLDMDVTDWEVGHVLHAGAINLPDKVEMVTDPEATVAQVRAPHVRAEAEAPAEAAVEAPVAEAPAAEAEE